MIKTIFFGILISGFLNGCENSSETMTETAKGENSNTSTEKTTFLALGDSYTIGESVDGNERWPVQLVQALNDSGFNVASPKIIAKTGWTTKDLLHAMETELGIEKFDLVSVLIGVNNQYQGKSISAYKEELHLIFEKAIKSSSRGKEGVFVVSIPDYGATPSGAANAEAIGEEIAKFNTVFQQVAEAYELPFYNITPISEKGKTQPNLVADDDLHPSGKQYQLWVEEFVDEVAALLESA